MTTKSEKPLTLAERFSAALDDDGQRWETNDGIGFEDLAAQMGASVTYSARDYDEDEDDDPHYVDGSSSGYISDDPIRYEFPDGSAIVTAGAGWDIEGEERYSWIGAR